MKRPLTLYRYRGLSGQGKDWVRRMIVDGEHYLASPLAFNDPFDCHPVVRREGSRSELFSYFYSILKKYEPELSKRAIRERANGLADRAIRGLTLRQTDEIIQAEYIKNSVSRLGVYCLTEVPDNILMWAHYADSHRGICIGFDSSHGFIGTAKPVRYQFERPTLNPVVQSLAEMLNSAVFSKSEHWRYEREWRVLSHRKGYGLHKSGSAKIVEIIIGSQAAVSDVQDLIGWIAASGGGIRILRASLSKTGYAINIGPI